MVVGENKFNVDPHWKLGSEVIQNVEEVEILGVTYNCTVEFPHAYRSCLRTDPVCGQ
jgi:hypothetical protein